MTWQEFWYETFGLDPPDRTSREVSVQELLAVPLLLTDAFPGNVVASGLARFLTRWSRSDLSPTAPRRLPSAIRVTALPRPPSTTTQTAAAAIEHALQLAPSVAEARPGDSTERGIDVAFNSDRDAHIARLAVKQALTEHGYEGCVTVWRWRPESTGTAATPVGAKEGRELRLAPVGSTTG